MARPRPAASAMVRPIVAASPAWTPQAMLADVASAIRASSWGAPSPRSQLRSTRIRQLREARLIDGHEANLIARVQRKRLGPPGVEHRERRAADDPPAAWAVGGIHARLAPGDPHRSRGDARAGRRQPGRG